MSDNPQELLDQIDQQLERIIQTKDLINWVRQSPDAYKIDVAAISRPTLQPKTRKPRTGSGKDGVLITAEQLERQATRAKLSRYRCSAKSRGLVWALTDVQATELFSRACMYCGQEGPGGIDRQDNVIGYEPANCVPCCGICNMMKGSLSLPVWLAWLARVKRCAGQQG